VTSFEPEILGKTAIIGEKAVANQERRRK